MATGFKTDACAEKCCTRLVISDITGPFDAVTNPDGWGAVGREPANVTLATITVITPAGDTIGPIDVSGAIPDPVLGDFELTEIDVTKKDGEYQLTYLLTISGIDYRNFDTFYSTCATRECVDQLWIKTAKDEASTNTGNCSNGCSGSCNCNSKKNNCSSSSCKSCGNALEDALYMESLHTSLRISSAHSKDSTRDNLLTKLEKFCQFNECDCCPAGTNCNC